MIRLAIGLVLILGSVAEAGPPADIWIRPEMGDPIAKMQAAKAVAIGTCTRSEELPVGTGMPEFSIRSPIRGSCVSHFLVRSTAYWGEQYKEGERYLLVLQGGEESARNGPKIYEGVVLPGLNLASIQRGEEGRAVTRGKDVWSYGHGSKAEQSEVVTRWLASPEPSEYAYSLYALQAHDGLWRTEDESLLVKRLRARTWPGPEAATILSRHSSLAVRSLAMELAQSGPEDRRLAVRLAATDTSQWSRDWLGEIADDPDRTVWQEWIRILEPPLNASQLGLLENVLDQLEPRDWQSVQEAIARAGTDSTRLTAHVIANWIRRTPLSVFPPRSAGEKGTWSDAKVIGNLSSLDGLVRSKAITETGRRKLEPGLVILRRRLETNQAPGGKEVDYLEALEMIRALGEGRDRSAVPQLMEYAHIPQSNVRAAVYFALGQIGDPRGLGVLRPVLLGPCGPESYAAATAIATLGDEEDIPSLAQWARVCKSVRLQALAAIGAIGGNEQAIGVVMQVYGGSLSNLDWAEVSRLGIEIQRLRNQRQASR